MYRTTAGKIGLFLLKKIIRLLSVICWALFVIFLLSNIGSSSLKPFKKYNQSSNYRHEVKYFEVANTNSDDDDSVLSILNNSVHLYSAIAYNSTNDSFYDVIHLSGWENRDRPTTLKWNYTCCELYHKDGTIRTIGTRLRARNDWYYVGKSKQEVKQFVCGNVFQKRGLTPIAVTIGWDRKCPSDHSKYVKVIYPKKESDDKIGVCAKLIYGEIEASTLVEWFEYQRLMGVSKIISYTQDLNVQAMAVLDYYRQIGLCEHYPFDVPILDGKKRYVGVKNFQGWNDEQIVVYDCQGKLSGYKYMGLYDVDEYIHAPLDNNLLSLMKRLESRYPAAGGYSFKTEVYASTWGVDNSSDVINDIAIGRYALRTEPFRDRVKSVVVVDRLVPGRLSTHGFWAKKPYKKAFVAEDVATLKHYRTCRKEWMKKSGEKCYKTIEKFHDTSMFKSAAAIRNSVNEVKYILGIE